MSENIIQELYDAMEAEYKIIQSSKKKADAPCMLETCRIKNLFAANRRKTYGRYFSKNVFSKQGVYKRIV